MQVTRLLTALKSVISPSRSSKLKAESISPRLESEQRSLSPEEILRKGQAASELMANPLLAESLGALEADLLAQIRTVSLADVAGHTRLVLAVQVTGAVTRHLKHLIHDGQVAAESISLRGKRID